MNTMKTFLLMAAMTALFMVAGQAMGGQQGMTMALLLAVGLNFFAYWNSDKLALRMNGAREVSENEAADLHAMVAMLAQRAGIPKPRVYVVDNPTPNAFATGRNPDHAAVAVTTGLMHALDRSEGVIAHELCTSRTATFSSAPLPRSWPAPSPTWPTSPCSSAAAAAAKRGAAAAT